jgi:hypothetical protein
MKALSTLARATSLLYFAVSPFAAAAHDLSGIIAEQDALDPETRAKIDRANQLRREAVAEAGVNDTTDSVRAVVETTKLWKSGPISVCFFEGSKLARDAVEQLASDWSNGTGVRFDFGDGRTCDPNRPSKIRVSFRQRGNWSYVGTDARFVRPGEPTIGFANFDREMDSQGGFTASQRGTILHEFGHAIGFQHEHQSPASGCSEEFNWAALPQVLGV